MYGPVMMTMMKCNEGSSNSYDCGDDGMVVHGDDNGTGAGDNDETVLMEVIEYYKCCSADINRGDDDDDKMMMMMIASMVQYTFYLLTTLEYFRQNRDKEDSISNTTKCH